MRPSSHAVVSAAPESNPVTLEMLLLTYGPANAPSENSPTKNALQTTLHGIVQLLQKAEKSLAGMPFQAPVAAVNSIIDVINVCSVISLDLAILDNQLLRHLQTTWTLSIELFFRLGDVSNS